jgi:hypothetical protein
VNVSIIYQLDAYIEKDLHPWLQFNANKLSTPNLATQKHSFSTATLYTALGP